MLIEFGRNTEVDFYFFFFSSTASVCSHISICFPFPFFLSNTLPQSSSFFSISCSSSQSLHWLISRLPSLCHCSSISLSLYQRLSISRSLASSLQSVWMRLPWWSALQPNRRTCCSASNWPERKQSKAPGCEHFAATWQTPSARLMQWVATHKHTHVHKKKKVGSLTEQQAGKEAVTALSTAVYTEWTFSSPKTNWSSLALTISPKPQ